MNFHRNIPIVEYSAIILKIKIIHVLSATDWGKYVRIPKIMPVSIPIKEIIKENLIFLCIQKPINLSVLMIEWKRLALFKVEIKVGIDRVMYTSVLPNIMLNKMEIGHRKEYKLKLDFLKPRKLFSSQ